MTQLKDAGVELDAQVCPSLRFISLPIITAPTQHSLIPFTSYADHVANAGDVHKDEVGVRYLKMDLQQVDS
jgi:hypothetical protein